jgi:hypothetical protein
MAVQPYKDKEFKAFIQAIDDGQVGHWVEIARALNVSDETILKWKQLPEAQAAIQRGIDHALKCMQQAGSRDWKMWEAKLKMLGLNPASKLDINLNDPRKKILEKYLGEDDAGQTEEATS